MSEYGLRLRYRPDDEWFGEVDAVVNTDMFSGTGSAWFDRLHVKETFVATLRAYPLSKENLLLIEGGFWNGKTPEKIEQCHLRIAVRPYNLSGTLLVQVDLATRSHASPDIDLQQSVTARFLTTYAALEAFARELDQVLEGNREWAMLASRVD